MMRWVPLGLFALLAVALWVGLYREGRDELPSTLIEKGVPAFALPRLYEPEERVTDADLRGDGITVLNFWASWCGPCRVEHPDLSKLAEIDGVKLVGMTYDTDMSKAKGFLRALGNPFQKVGVDKRHRVKLDYGVAGLPETFVINSAGQIVYKHPGPIGPGDMEEKILPAIEAAR
ncbi:UNVERIFIED_CONTAM: hypothetical protein GTU68_051631 [Idotea baltica]|nr:hypothetical protein [Idotea baltica]